MLRADALKALGVHEGADLATIEAAFAAQAQGLLQRIGEAPTEALQAKLRESLTRLERAKRALTEGSQATGASHTAGSQPTGAALTAGSQPTTPPPTWARDSPRTTRAAWPLGRVRRLSTVATVPMRL